MTDDLALLRHAAIAAGALALAMRAEGLKAWSKSGGSPVTEADLAVDRLLHEMLRNARPDYGWLSEETIDDPARLSKRRVFVVDPIDGTVAYIKDRPWFSVAVSVVEDGRPIAGVVHAPAVGETYEARLGGGALLNGRPIRVSDTTALEDAAMLGAAQTLRAEGWPEMRVEKRDSVAYRMALVGAGDFDAAVALSTKCDWDLAAAELIAVEAGGVVTDHKGRPFLYNQPGTVQPSLVCATPALHPLILERVAHIDLPS